MAREREGKGLKKKYCKLCLEKVGFVDYKDDKRLGRFITDRGKIVPRRVSGPARDRRSRLTVAVKRARCAGSAALPPATCIAEGPLVRLVLRAFAVSLTLLTLCAVSTPLPWEPVVGWWCRSPSRWRCCCAGAGDRGRTRAGRAAVGDRDRRGPVCRLVSGGSRSRPSPAAGWGCAKRAAVPPPDSARGCLPPLLLLRRGTPWAFSYPDLVARLDGFLKQGDGNLRADRCSRSGIRAIGCARLQAALQESAALRTRFVAHRAAEPPVPVDGAAGHRGARTSRRGWRTGCAGPRSRARVSWSGGCPTARSGC